MWADVVVHFDLCREYLNLVYFVLILNDLVITQENISRWVCTGLVHCDQSFRDVNQEYVNFEFCR